MSAKEADLTETLEAAEPGEGAQCSHAGRDTGEGNA
ncbi:hypothetical protein ABIE77_001578 [Sinorhizobium fredii]